MIRPFYKIRYRFAWSVVLGLLQSGCIEFQVSNSFSNDAEVFDSGEAVALTSEGSTDLFAAARSVFERKCTSCHVHAFETYSEAELSTWLTPGSAEDSVLYQRLKGSGYSNATMPTDSELSEEDRLAIKSWIDGMTVTQEADSVDASDAREAESPNGE